jgi:hypothetical protein
MASGWPASRATTDSCGPKMLKNGGMPSITSASRTVSTSLPSRPRRILATWASTLMVISGSVQMASDSMCASTESSAGRRSSSALTVLASTGSVLGSNSAAQPATSRGARTIKEVVSADMCWQGPGS